MAGEDAVGQAGTELPAKHVDEQQQEDDRHDQQERGHPGVALQVLEVAPQHRGRVGGCRRDVIWSSGSVGVLAGEREETSSRSGSWIETVDVDARRFESVKHGTQRGR